LASRRSDTDHRLPAFAWLGADMAETSNRHSSAAAGEAVEKRDISVAEISNSAARVRELLGPAIAAPL